MHYCLQYIISISLARIKSISNTIFSPQYDASNMTMDPWFFGLLCSQHFFNKNQQNARRL